MNNIVKPYPAMKDSGMPWIGKIPNHWTMERAKRLFRKKDRPVKDSDEVVTCFRDGEVTLRKNRRLRGFTESLKEIGYQGIRRGDLVIHAMDAFAGAIGVSDSEGKGSPVYSICEPVPRANAFYYAYMLREMARSQWIQALAKGIRERSTDFRFDSFGSQLIPVPTLSEQDSIVRFLDHTDQRVRKYIRAKQKIMKLLEEQKQTTIHRAVTRGLNPNVRLRPSGVEWLGDVPRHWKVTQLRMLCERIKTGGTPTGANEVYFQSGGFNWYTPSDFGDPIELGDATRQLSGLGVQEVTKFPKNTILMIGIGATIGKVAISRKPCSCNQQINAIIPDDSIIHNNYLALFMRTLRNFIVNCGKFTTMPIINQEETKRLPALLPPVDEQIQIAEYIESAAKPFADAMFHAEREISFIREYCTRLIADVVTGKLDVREAAANLSNEVAEPENLDDTEVLTDENEEAILAAAE